MSQKQLRIRDATLIARGYIAAQDDLPITTFAMPFEYMKPHRARVYEARYRVPETMEVLTLLRFWVTNAGDVILKDDLRSEARRLLAEKSLTLPDRSAGPKPRR